MQAHLIDQLRDIHSPAAPPDDTVQITLLLMLLSLLTLSVVYLLWRVVRPGLPAWQHRALAALAAAKRLNKDDALASAAVTLRQAAQHLSADHAVRKSTGSDYLRRLDGLFGVDFFSRGAGSVFGDALYRDQFSQQAVDDALDGLHQLLRRRRR